MHRSNFGIFSFIFWLYVIVNENESGIRQQEVYSVYDPLNGNQTTDFYSTKIQTIHGNDSITLLSDGREEQGTLYIDRSNVDDGHINNRLKFTYEMLRSWCILFTACYPVLFGKCVRFCAVSYHHRFVVPLYIFPIYIMYMDILTFRNGLWLGLISC